MKYAALFTLLSFALSCPVMAKPRSHHHFYSHHHHHDAARASHHHEVGRASRHHEAAHTSRHREAARAPQHADRETAHTSHSGITCEMVRAYVAKVGMGQAIAMAKSAGISAAEEERARQCLAKKI
jgi:hypothetical protein